MQLNILSVSYLFLFVFLGVLIISIGYWCYKREYFMAKQIKIAKKKNPVFFWMFVLLYYSLGVFIFFFAFALVGFF
jgi:hypothetical protein